MFSLCWAENRTYSVFWMCVGDGYLLQRATFIVSLYFIQLTDNIMIKTHPYMLQACKDVLCSALDIAYN